MSQALDLKMGEENENKNVATLSSFFKTNLTKDKNIYATIDWTNSSNTIYVELKSRRIHHNLYPTAVIGLNKVNFCTDPNKKYYFVFAYSDGLYYIQYERDLFKTFSIQPMKITFRKDVGRHEINDVIHIPVDLLIKIENNKTIEDEN
jgi:hypothetical protein